MTEENKVTDELIPCGCGQCDLKIKPFDNKKRPRKYANGHSWRGRKHTEETKKKLSKANKGRKIGPFSDEHIRKLIENHTRAEKHPMWKGDDVGYSVLHRWIRKHLPKPNDNLCILCKKNPIRDVACITGIYNRELKNWAWFCRGCNCTWDNVYERANITKKKKLTSSG